MILNHDDAVRVERGFIRREDEKPNLKPSRPVQARFRRRSQTMNEDSKSVTLSEDRIDESLEESFPASDPPSWIVGIGAPSK